MRLLITPIIFCGIVLTALAQKDEPVITYPNIAYSTESPRHRLDIYAPEDIENFPILMFVSGGGWTDGSRLWVTHLGSYFAPQGIGVVLVDHQLGVEPRQQAADLALAFAWVKQNIADYGGNPAQVMIGGHSAGGHLVALMVMDERILGAVHHKPADVGGVITVSAMFDVSARFGEETSPPHFVQGELPPFLLLAAHRDFANVHQDNPAMESALHDAGNDAQYIVISTADHFSIIGDETALQTILEWITELLS